MSSSQDMESGGAVVPADVLLVRRALAGQQDAVATLVARLMPVIRARVRRALATGGRQLRAMDGDDLTQEVWLLLIAHSGRQLLVWAPERGMTATGGRPTRWPPCSGWTSRWSTTGSTRSAASPEPSSSADEKRIHREKERRPASVKRM